MAYEGNTSSGARSGATGATGTMGSSAGVTEGVRGLNITDKSGVRNLYLPGFTVITALTASS